MRERKNHYSIRKLTIGVASVLIGISFFGIKANTVQADTINSNESISQESKQEENKQQTNANTSESAQDETITIKSATTETQNANKPLVVEAKAAKTDLKAQDSNSLNRDAARTVKQDSESKVKTAVTPHADETKETKLIADNPSATNTSNVQEDRSNPAANQAKVGKTAPAASVAFDKDSTLAVDHAQLDEKQTSAKLTMKSSDFKAGDTYTITIPKNGGLSIDATDVAALAPVFGKTTFTESNNYYTIENHFINGGTISQGITLHYDQSIKPLALMTNTITVDTTGSVEKHASLKVAAIGKEPELSADSIHVPDAIVNKKEFTSQNTATFGTPLNDFTQVDLTLALDKNYRLTNIAFNDEDRSLVLTPDQLTIDDDNVAHIILTKEQIAGLSNNQPNHFTFKITGHFDIPESSFVNKKYHTKLIDKDKSTISGTMVNVTTKPSHLESRIGVGVDQDLTVYPSVGDIDWASAINYLTEYTAHDKNNPEKDTNGYEVIDGKQSSTTDMHYFVISNQSAESLANATLTVDLPDGYNIPSTLTLSSLTNGNATAVDSNNVKFIATYTDGTSAVITPSQTGNNLTLGLATDKKVRSLNMQVAQWNPNVEYNLASSHGTYAETYANGTPVLVGDLLTTKTTLSSPSFNGEVLLPMTTINDRLVNKESQFKEGVFTAVYPVNQTSAIPGEKNAGTMTYETCASAYGHPMLEHPITYVMVPDNAEIADLSKATVKYSGAYLHNQPVLTPKSVSVISVDSHRFIKFDLSNYDLLEDGLNVTVHYSNAPDVQNSTKPTVFFTIADNLKNGNLNDPDQTVAQALKGLVQKENLDVSKVVYNGTNAGYNGFWKINTADGMSSATMVSGNTSGISTSAKQNVHGANPDQIKIYGSIINATNNQISNAYQIINIPDSQDQISQFTPTMSGQASIVDPVNGTDLSNTGELLYSTELTDLNNAQAAANGAQWLTADQITDWSKVKSVMLKFDSQDLPARTSARVEIPLVDKDIYQHVGKSISVSSAIFSENKASSDSNLPNLVILPGSAASAKLTVVGQAKVNVKVHYKDDQGNDHYVDLPDQAKTYQEGQDTMKSGDFMNSSSDLTDADRVLLPAHMVINWTAKPTIQNSEMQYPAGYHNGTAAFDQVVAPDFDGDTLIYEGAFAKPVTKTSRVTRTIEFVNQTGKKLMPDIVQHSMEFSRSGFEDPFTHKITWATMSGSEILPGLSAPIINGYTPESEGVDAKEVSFNDSDSTEKIEYTANKQTIKVKYIDATTGQTLRTDTVKGKSDAQSGYTTKNQITDYQAQHYILAVDDSNGQDLVFDRNDAQDQIYNVYLEHDIKLVQREASSTRTITYIGAGDLTPGQVTQTVYFYQFGTKDLVTGKTQWDDIAAQNYSVIYTPWIPGYTPDKSQVDRTPVKWGDPDTEAVVTYTPNNQVIKVNYIDDTTGQTLRTDTINGKSDAQSGYSTKSQIAEYQGQHYDLVSDSTDGADLIFDHYDNKTQSYDVHFSHETKPDSRQASVTRTIIYTGAGDKTPDEIVQTVHFAQTGTKDLVTGETKWNAAADQSFASVGTPEVAGYTPDKSQVDEATVKYGDPDSVVTVTYTADVQVIKVNYIDDTTGETLDNKTLTGVSDVAANYNTKADISTYEKQHYVLVSDSSNGQDLFFDHDDKQDQVYDVHFTHGMVPDQREDSVIRLITYTGAGDKTPGQVTQTVHFVQTGTKDLVTGNTKWDAVADQSFALVTTPEVAGYTPDKSQVDKATVKYGDPDSVVTVTYTADAQVIKVNYIDDTTGQILKTDTINGKSDVQSGYTTENQIAEYQNRHYDLVSDATKGAELVFDHNDQATQSYDVHFSHATKSDSRQSTVTRTIIYTGAGEATPESKTQTVHFTQTGTKDLVTGKTKWNAVANQSFGAIATPEVMGYTPDKSQVDEATVKYGNPDSVVTVTYTADAQVIKVNYIDDTTGETLAGKTLTGVSDMKANYNTKTDISNYEKLHYVLVSDSSNGQDLVFDHDDKKDQVYEIHFTHSMIPAQREDSVTRVITYTGAGDKTPNEVTQSIHFVQTGTRDLVTGTTKWDAVADQNFVSVGTPEVVGYTPDKSQVDEATVKYGDQDSTITVTYAADAQVIKVNYIDDTIGRILKTDTINGKSDAQSGYSTENQIAEYQNRHYDLVSDATKGAKLVFDHDDQATQSYDVHFSHATKPDSRQASVTRTIIYTGAGDKTPGQVTQTVHFVQTGTKDLVTSKTKWDAVADQSFVSVVTPEVAGYTPDKSQVDKATVKYGAKDTVVTVTYTADQQEAKLRFYDDTMKKFIEVAPTLNANGKADDQISFTIPDSYDFSNYNFVNVTKSADPESTDKLSGADLSSVQYGKYDTNDQKDQDFVAHFTHKIKTINEKVTINETVHYVYEDGSKAHDDYRATPLVFTKTGTKDLVTGEEKATWTKSQKFAEVVSPEISGYKPNQTVVPAVEVAHGDKDVVRTVTYSRIADPQKPTTPTDKPEVPTNTPDTPVTPEVPKGEETQKPVIPNKHTVHPHADNSPKKKDKHSENSTKEIKTAEKSATRSTVKPKSATVTKNSNAKVELSSKGEVKAKAPKVIANSKGMPANRKTTSNNAKTLPQTGEKANKLGILGLLTLSLASLFGFSEKKKKED